MKARTKEKRSSCLLEEISPIMSFFLFSPLCLIIFIILLCSRCFCTDLIFESDSFAAIRSTLPEEKQERNSVTCPPRPSFGINADSTFLPFTMFSRCGQTLFSPRRIRVPRRFNFQLASAIVSSHSLKLFAFYDS